MLSPPWSIDSKKHTSAKIACHSRFPRSFFGNIIYIHWMCPTLFVFTGITSFITPNIDWNRFGTIARFKFWSTNLPQIIWIRDGEWANLGIRKSITSVWRERGFHGNEERWQRRNSSVVEYCFNDRHQCSIRYVLWAKNIHTLIWEGIVFGISSV